LDFLLDTAVEAFRLLRDRDPDTLRAVGISLKVSAASTALAAALGIPLGVCVGMGRFPGRRAVVVLLHTAMAVPTVVVGLFVYFLICRRGPLGEFGLLFTPWAMVVGQTLLALPILAAFTLAAVEGADARIAETARTLGATRAREAWAVLAECRAGIAAAVAAGFGRVFAEVGVSMMLGGNIRGLTRNIPTTIALETGKGEFAMGLALGAVLLLVALIVNLAVQTLRPAAGR
jgi:tungstate transport system permease protein